MNSENHPRFKLLKNAAAVIAGIVGVGYAIGAVRGNENYELEGASNHITGIKASDFLITLGVGSGGGGSVPLPGLILASDGYLTSLAAAGAGVNTRGTFGSLGAQMYSQDFEREADYVGMYILANSGIEREGVANFWRRMSIENPRSISYASTHPSSSERWVNIEAVNKEIDKKILESEPLLPERVQIED